MTGNLPASGRKAGPGRARARPARRVLPSVVGAAFLLASSSIRCSTSSWFGFADKAGHPSFEQFRLLLQRPVDRGPADLLRDLDLDDGDLDRPWLSAPPTFPGAGRRSPARQAAHPCADAVLDGPAVGDRLDDLVGQRAVATRLTGSWHRISADAQPDRRPGQHPACLPAHRTSATIGYAGNFTATWSARP